jgi:hypothetical protein
VFTNDEVKFYCILYYRKKIPWDCACYTFSSFKEIRETEKNRWACACHTFPVSKKEGGKRRKLYLGLALITPSRFEERTGKQGENNPWACACHTFPVSKTQGGERKNNTLGLRLSHFAVSC